MDLNFYALFLILLLLFHLKFWEGIITYSVNEVKIYPRGAASQKRCANGINVTGPNFDQMDVSEWVLNFSN
jgi:hypothetical protein